MNGDEVRGTWFCRVEPARGYDVAEVDDLLARVAAELDAGRPAGPLIEAAALRRRIWKRGYDIDAVDWFLGRFLAGNRLEPGGASADPWRDLAVAQLTRSSASSAAKAARLASRQEFSNECAGAWNDFGQLPGVHLRWGWVEGGRNELRTEEEEEAIAFLQDGNPHASSELMTASISGKSFSLRRTDPASSWGCLGPSGLRILIGSSPERTGSSAREIPEVHA